MSNKIHVSEEQNPLESSSSKNIEKSSKSGSQNKEQTNHGNKHRSIYKQISDYYSSKKEAFQTLFNVSFMMIGVADFITDIIAMVDYVETQQYWYFSIMLFFSVMAMCFNSIYPCLAFKNKFLAFLDIFFPVVFFDERGKNENLYLVIKKTVAFIQSFPSSWIACYSIFVSHQEQSISIYISFLFSAVGFGFGILPVNMVDDFPERLNYITWKPKLLIVFFAACDALSAPILWSLFAYFTSPYGAWLYPFTLGIAINAVFFIIYVKIKTRKHNAHLSFNHFFFYFKTFCLIALGCVFSNFLSPIIYLVRDHTFVYFDDAELMGPLKLMGLLFLIIFDGIVLGVSDDFRNKVFFSSINVVFIILGFVAGGLTILLILVTKIIRIRNRRKQMSLYGRTIK